MKKVWLITGASSGIGAGNVRAALDTGDQVVASARNLEKLKAALGEHENLAFAELDVTEPEQADRAVSVALERFGQLDVLVNSAGYSHLGNFEELTVSDIEDQFKTNFYGVVHLMKAALPVMRKQRAGHVINISSVAGVVGLKHCAAYAATKFAVEGMTLSVAPELERFGVRLTVVEPGFFKTDLLASNNVRYGLNTIEDYADEGSTEAMWSVYHGAQPGDPDKLGHVLVQLSRMDNPPAVFAAGSDALNMIVPAIQARLDQVQAYPEWSKASDS